MLTPCMQQLGPAFSSCARFFLFFTLLLIGTACTPKASSSVTKVEKNVITTTSFGDTPDGEAFLYTLENKQGMRISLTNYGGIITKIIAPDRDGKFADVVLGFDKLAPYLDVHPYFGAIIGRYGNRIAKGEFSLDGKEYQLPINNEPNSLHGGDRGFDKRLWSGETFYKDNLTGVKLTYTSPDGEQGYPGKLTVTVTYTLNEDNELAISYLAQTDAPTPINLTNHTYFNLAGKGDILGHELQLKADQFTPIDKGLIPTGELRPVAGTPFDFTTAKPIGKDIDQDTEQLRFGLGYDHNFVVNQAGSGLELIATVYEPTSGRTLEVLTEEPGVQFYTGNFLNGTLRGKDRVVYKYRSGFCLETQHFPDSPNQADFPTTILLPGEWYTSKTVYRFGAK